MMLPWIDPTKLFTLRFCTVRAVAANRDPSSQQVGPSRTLPGSDESLSFCDGHKVPIVFAASPRLLAGNRDVVSRTK
jgi:hypothetical protein